MLALVINSGSTSVKAAVVDVASSPAEHHVVRRLEAERLGSDAAIVTIFDRAGEAIDQASCSPRHAEVLRQWLPRLLARDLTSETSGAPMEVAAVGHRVVHGGADFTSPTVVDDHVLSSLQQTVQLAPLHNPSNLAGIQISRELLPALPHVAVFDTAFHRTLPTRAAKYAIPTKLAEQHGLRRYGFHGVSHQYVAERAASYLERPLRDLKLISCHLGGGCSVCAIEFGRSVETSMGFTPLEGLVMATRSGDIDPGALFHVARSEGWDLDRLEQLLNRESGLAGLSAVGADMRDTERGAEEGNAGCQLALQVFCHRVRKYVGAYAAVLGGVDAILFTGGIGQNSSVVRHRVMQRMQFLGVTLDEPLNREARIDGKTPLADVATTASSVRVLAVKTNETLAIARKTLQRLELWQPVDEASTSESVVPPKQPRTIPVAISARHVHLTQDMVEALFGEGRQLTPLKPLSQPGQFAAEEQVTIVGPKRSIERVRVLGPTRSQNQVEVSRTDEFHLGVDAPIRASGHIEDTPGITLVGDAGRSVTLERGLICAWRHIHMTPDDARAFGVNDGDIVDVEVGEAGVRSLTFGDVLVRVKSSYRLEMHIDTDEGNAAELRRVDEGRMERDVLVDCTIGSLKRRLEP